MTLDYKIELEDYLTYNLYIASKSERIRKKRQKNKIVVPVVYVAGALVFLWFGQLVIVALFFLFAVLWFLLFPHFERRRYVKHYRGFLEEQYRERAGIAFNLELNREYILAKERGGDGRVLTSEVQDICEIPELFLIRLKGNQSFILPKHNFPDIERVQRGLKENAALWEFRWVAEPDWRWR